jgi:uncharacterized protein (DUF885 family)
LNIAIILSLAGVLLMASAASAAGATAHPDDLEALARDFWTWRAATQPISGDDVPRVDRPAGWAPDWSPRSIEERRKTLAEFEHRWTMLASPSAPVARRIDHRLMGSALARVRWELDGNPSWRRNPGFYVDQTVDAYVDAIVPPATLPAARGRDVIARLRSIPGTLAAARENLDDARAPFARLAIEDLDGIAGKLRRSAQALAPHLDPASADALPGAVDRAIAALEEYREWLRGRLASLPENVAIGRAGYVEFLRTVALIPHSPEEILAMGRQEYARAVAFEEYERQRHRELQELPIFASQAEQIAGADRDERAVREYLGARGILTVPADAPRYRYLPMPDWLAPVADFGEGTDFPFASRLSEESTRYIPPPSPSLGYFALSMAKEPRADMVHEGLPGHAFQLWLSRSQPDFVRRFWYDSGVNEGIGFYAEEMMLEMGLFDDRPKSREMIANYMRLRALRVEVDVRLALGSFTIDEAADYLRTRVPVDAATARREAASFAATPGFAIGYQIGKLDILRLLADARRSQGEKFKLQEFHDFVWKNGNVPLALQRWELLGDRSDMELLGAPATR